MCNIDWLEFWISGRKMGRAVILAGNAQFKVCEYLLGYQWHNESKAVMVQHI
jgi:hypothetical protein